MAGSALPMDNTQAIQLAITLGSLLLALVLDWLLLGWIFRRLVRWFGRVPLLEILAEQEKRAVRVSVLAVAIAMIAGATLMALAVTGVDIEPVTRRLERFGLDSGAWLGTHGLRILIISSLGYLVYRTVRRALGPTVRTALLIGKEGVELDEASKRAEALIGVGHHSIAVVIVLIVGFMVLSELSVNVGPILAGVGVAGIALGFGAQHLVRDIISGIFILAEDQYRVGDVARVAGKAGLVEKVNLRRTVLRDLDGIVHVIPNGEVTTSSNYTKSFARVNLNISVAYKENIDHVMGVLNRIGQEMAQDDYFGPLIIEAPRTLGVDSFDDSGIAIKMLGVTKPMQHWDVGRELRRRIKIRFDEEGIEIPFPHRTIYWGVDSDPRLEPAWTSRMKRDSEEGAREEHPPAEGEAPGREGDHES